MIAKVKLLANYDEISSYNAAVEEYGIDELKVLGKYTTPPIERFVKKDFLFHLKEVSFAWIVGDENELINLKTDDGEIWSLYYDSELWDKLKEHFRE